MTLPHEFYDRPTLEVARELLGKVLVHRQNGQATSGIIVEVEAYIGESDPACHASCGPTRRNAPLYGPPGFAYVYLNYGIHSLVNAVTEPEGAPAAVLIRALEPLAGVAAMRRRRASVNKGRPRQTRPIDYATLCQGPGNLTRALGITLAENGANLTGRSVFIEDCGSPVAAMAWGPRIGIRVGTEHHWRAWIEGHPSVSGKRS